MLTATLNQDSQKLPQGWEWIALGDLCQRLNRGKTPKYSSTGPLVIKTRHVYAEGFPVFPDQRSSSSYTQDVFIRQGDILMTAMGRGSIGRLFLFDKDLGDQFVTDGCIFTIRPNEKVLSKWILLFLASPKGQEEIFARESGTAFAEKRGQTQIKPADLATLEIPIPSPEDLKRSVLIQQKVITRIESLVQEVQESRKICDRMYRDANRLLEVAVNEVFTKLDSVIETVPFEEIGTAFNGRASGSGESSVRVFKTRHTYPHKLKLGDPSYAKPEQAPKLPQERFLRPGDTLMANIAEGTLGRVSYVHECEDNWTVDTQIMILRSKDENEVLGKWIYYYFWSERGQREILSRRTGIAFADKRGQTHIYPRDMQTIPFPKMPINAQRQAVAYLDTVLNESEKMTELVQQDMKTLDLLEQSILDRAFRGEL